MTLLLLDDFLTQPGSAESSPDPYEVGYQAGQEEAERRAEQNIAALREELAQNIADLGFTYAEAETRVLSRLKPLFDTLAQKLVPLTGDTQFWLALSDYLNSVAEQDLEQGLSLALHPDMVDAATSVLGSQTSHITIQADPKLEVHAAWISHGAHQTSLDTGRVIKVMQNALLALGATSDGEHAYG